MQSSNVMTEENSVHRSSLKRPLLANVDTLSLRKHAGDLYAHSATWDCAHENCIVCAYKVACFDIALDKEFTKAWPNQRPETCPRLSRGLPTDHPTTRMPSWTCLRKGRVLTVGDGDFSFSVAVARQMGNEAKNLTATSYESKSTLEQVYRPQTLQGYWDELKSYGAQIYFQVDATRLPVHLQETAWDLVVWNFPCTAIADGQDGQNQAMEDNKALVRKFCARVSAQEIHMAHKTKPPYDQWGLVDLVTSVQGSHGDTWKYAGRIVLDRSLWLPYVPRKALDQKSFPCHDACTYVFQRCHDDKKSWLRKDLVSVTDDRLLGLRHYWMQQKSIEKHSKSKPKKSRLHR